MFGEIQKDKDCMVSPLWVNSNNADLIKVESKVLVTRGWGGEVAGMESIDPWNLSYSQKGARGSSVPWNRGVITVIIYCTFQKARRKGFKNYYHTEIINV